jgi:hypothetical protein
MSSDIDLERRLRSHLVAERQAYEPPVLLASRIQQAIRRGSHPVRRPALMPQLAAAAGLIVLVALLSVGVAVVKNGGLSQLGGPAVTSPSPATYRVATEPNERYLLIRLDTVLHGQANSDGTACLWYGDGAERVALVWPPGYVARGNPLAVYDGSGALIGVVGQHIALGGGGGPNGGSSVSVLGCSPVSGIWIVSPNWGVSPK